MKRKLRLAARPAAVAATGASVASAHLGILHAGLRFLDYVASWRVILEIARSASEIAAVRAFGLAIVSLGGISLTVYLIYDRLENRRQDSGQDREFNGLHQ